MHIVLDAIKFTLNANALVVCKLNIVSNVLRLVLQFLDLPLLLSLVHVCEELELLNFLIVPLVVILQSVCLLIQHVHVVVQTVILLLSFNKRGHNFINI